MPPSDRPAPRAARASSRRARQPRRGGPRRAPFGTCPPPRPVALAVGVPACGAATRMARALRVCSPREVHIPRRASHAQCRLFPVPVAVRERRRGGRRQRRVPARGHHAQVHRRHRLRIRARRKGRGDPVDLPRHAADRPQAAGAVHGLRRRAARQHVHEPAAGLDRRAVQGQEGRLAVRRIRRRRDGPAVGARRRLLRAGRGPERHRGRQRTHDLRGQRRQAPDRHAVIGRGRLLGRDLQRALRHRGGLAAAPPRARSGASRGAVAPVSAAARPAPAASATGPACGIPVPWDGSRCPIHRRGAACRGRRPGACAGSASPARRACG